MRDEKEERKKQARSNKQTRQSNTAHPRQSLFLEKILLMRCLRWDMYSNCAIAQLHFWNQQISIAFLALGLVTIIIPSETTYMCIYHLYTT